jgi:hypothetical protein
VLKGRRNRNNMYKVHVSIFLDGAEKEEAATRSAWATESPMRIWTPDQENE